MVQNLLQIRSISLSVNVNLAMPNKQKLNYKTQLLLQMDMYVSICFYMQNNKSGKTIR
jgi:hypothetical protein